LTVNDAVTTCVTLLVETRLTCFVDHNSAEVAVQYLVNATNRRKFSTKFFN